MTQNRDEKFAEWWLDGALNRYSDAAPRPGFEARLIARLAAAEQENKTRRWFVLRRPIWIPAVCLAVIVLVAGIVILQHSQSAPPQVETQAQITTPAARESLSSETAAEVPGPVEAEVHAARRPETSGSTRTVQTTKKISAPEPRREQFPSPLPLTEQERLLLQYVKATPHQELVTVATMQAESREESERNARDSGSPSGETPPTQINDLLSVPPDTINMERRAIGAR